MKKTLSFIMVMDLASKPLLSYDRTRLVVLNQLPLAPQDNKLVKNRLTPLN